MILILIFSILFQLFAAFFAIKLVDITKSIKQAWIMIAIALILMSFRRAISLYLILNGVSYGTFEIINEVIGLVLSLSMMMGIFGIAPLFNTVKRSEQEIKRSRDALQTKLKIEEQMNEVMVGRELKKKLLIK
ncbi:MAG: hypothetical protein ACYC3G_04825 [Minisyncoccota bacterium]